MWKVASWPTAGKKVGGMRPATCWTVGSLIQPYLQPVPAFIVVVFVVAVVGVVIVVPVVVLIVFRVVRHNVGRVAR